MSCMWSGFSNKYHSTNKVFSSLYIWCTCTAGCQFWTVSRLQTVWLQNGNQTMCNSLCAFVFIFELQRDLMSKRPVKDMGSPIVINCTHKGGKTGVSLQQEGLEICVTFDLLHLFPPWLLLFWSMLACHIISYTWKK